MLQYLATNIFEVDINAIRAELLQAGCQVLGGFVVEGSIIAKLVLQQLDL